MIQHTDVVRRIRVNLVKPVKLGENVRVAANFIAQPAALDAKGGRSVVPGRSLLAVEFETIVREEFFGAGNGKRQFLFFGAYV